MEVTKPHVVDLWCAGPSTSDPLELPGQGTPTDQNDIAKRTRRVSVEAGHDTAVCTVWIVMTDSVNTIHVEVSNDPEPSEVGQELAKWGFHNPIIPLHKEQYVADYLTWDDGHAAEAKCLYVRPNRTEPPILVRKETTDDHITHMRRLCEQGFAKTVVTRIDDCGKGTQVILFEDYSEAAADQQIAKATPALSPELGRRAHSTIRRKLQAKPGTSTHCVSLPLPVAELEDILGSSKDILRQETDHLPLSPEQIAEIHNHSR